MSANSSGLPIRPMGMSGVERVAIHWSRLIPARAARSFWCPMKRSVWIRPGSTMFTVMPSFARSPARVLNMPAMPGRIPLERMSPSTGCLTELDWMARMRPHFFFFMSGSTARMKRTVERCTCWKAAVQCSSVICSKGPGGGPPTLATRMSMPPHCSRVFETTRSMSSGLLASAGTASTSAPVRVRTSSAAVLRSASPRAHMLTRAPSAAKPMAEALPMPLLAATTSATLPLSPSSTTALRSGDLLVELRAIADRHVEALELFVPHHLELDALARAAAPQGEVELLARRHLEGVEGYDHVPLLDAALCAGPARHQTSHHHALLEGMREDAEPGSGGPARRPPVTEVVLAVAQIALAGNGKGRAHDLSEVERDHPDHAAGQGEERPAIETGIGGRRDKAPLQHVLPVRLELSEVGEEPTRHAAVARTRGRHREHRLAAIEILRRAHRHRGQPRPLHLEEGQAQLEVLRHELRPLRSPLGEAHVYRLAAHHDVVDGENEAARINHRARARALVAQHARGRMRGWNLGVNVHHHGKQSLDELDGGIHGSIAHASTPPGERATRTRHHRGGPLSTRARKVSTCRCASAAASTS